MTLLLAAGFGLTAQGSSASTSLTTATTTATSTNSTAVALSAAFIANPVVANHLWGYQEWYSRSYVRQYAGWYGAIEVAKLVCGDLPPGGKQVCNLAVGKYLGWISGTWSYAKNTSQCLTMKELWTGQVIGIQAYGCNWN
jgi:hypothetical protein